MSKKKEIRANFRQAVFTRDKNKCRVCEKENEGNHDAHHMTDRSLIINGGYVKENGITLCPECHEKAEIYHSTGKEIPEWTPNDLYKLIGSSYDLAVEKSKELPV